MGLELSVGEMNYRYKTRPGETAGQFYRATGRSGAFAGRFGADAKGLEIIISGAVESPSQGRVSSPPGATLMEYIFRLMEHSAENQFSFGDA